MGRPGRPGGADRRRRVRQVASDPGQRAACGAARCRNPRQRRAHGRGGDPSAGQNQKDPRPAGPGCRRPGHAVRRASPARHELAADAGPGPARHVDLGRDRRPEGARPARQGIRRHPRADRPGAVRRRGADHHRRVLPQRGVRLRHLAARLPGPASRLLPGAPAHQNGDRLGHRRRPGAGRGHDAGPAVGAGLVRTPARHRSRRHDGVLRRGARPYRRHEERQAGRDSPVRACRQAGRGRRYPACSEPSCARRRTPSPGAA